MVNESKKNAEEFVSYAIERSINYFDAATHCGNPEELLGPAILFYRDNLSLACKTLEINRKDSRKELEDSFKEIKN